MQAGTILMPDAFVLAGGGSTRMGTDKALLDFEGATLIERALRMMRSLGLTPRIVGSRPDLEQYAPVVADLRAQCGPLSGIEAGLLAAGSEAAVFLPVDIPLMPARFVGQLIARAEVTRASATIPRLSGRHQPLTAVYRRDLLPFISQALAAGDYKVMRVIEQSAATLGRPVDTFDVESVSTASSEHDGWPQFAAHAFLNCNTPEDIRHAAWFAGHLNNNNRL